MTTTAYYFPMCSVAYVKCWKGDRDCVHVIRLCQCTRTKTKPSTA